MISVTPYLVFVQVDVLVLLFSLALECDDNETDEDVDHEEGDDDDVDEVVDGHHLSVVVDGAQVLRVLESIDVYSSLWGRGRTERERGGQSSDSTAAWSAGAGRMPSKQRAQRVNNTVIPSLLIHIGKTLTGMFRTFVQ